MASWPDLVSALLIGVVKGRPDLTAAAGVIFGRLALLWTNERDSSIYPQLIGTAPAHQVEGLVHHAVACLEADSHPSRRAILLQEVVTAAKKRGIDHGADAVARWSAELPPRETGDSSDDPFATVATLEELASTSHWWAIRARGALCGLLSVMPRKVAMRLRRSCTRVLGLSATTSAALKRSQRWRWRPDDDRMRCPVCTGCSNVRRNEATGAACCGVMPKNASTD